jgi:hypothetical protein
VNDAIEEFAATCGRLVGAVAAGASTREVMRDLAEALTGIEAEFRAALRYIAVMCT